MIGTIAFDPGRKNLAMCLVDADATIKKWATISIDPTPRGLIRGLESMRLDDEWLPHASHAVIERQPAKNPTMKKLEHYLEAVCSMKGLETRTIDAKHKLSYAMTTPWWPNRDVATWSYAERKKLSVETVANMLDSSQDADTVEFFKKSKKKDDLADSYLHAAAFVKHVFPNAPTIQDAPVRRINPVKPCERNAKRGAYTQGNLKFLAKGLLGSFDAFEAGADTIDGFAKSCYTHFGGLREAYVQLGGK
jgi:hypothetical protein